jgi:hypothetical protein
LKRGITTDRDSNTSLPCFWPFSGGRSFWQDNDDVVSSGRICLGTEGDGG